MANELFVQKIVNDKVYYTNGNLGSTVYTKIITKSPVIKHRGREYKFNRESNTIALTDVVKTDGLMPMVTKSEFSINQRFKFLEKFTGMVISNVTASLLVCGQSGLGKCLEKSTKLKIDVPTNLFNEITRLKGIKMQ